MAGSIIRDCCCGSCTEALLSSFKDQVVFSQPVAPVARVYENVRFPNRPTNKEGLQQDNSLHIPAVAPVVAPVVSPIMHKPIDNIQKPKVRMVRAVQPMQQQQQQQKQNTNRNLNKGVYMLRTKQEEDKFLPLVVDEEGYLIPASCPHSYSNVEDKSFFNSAENEEQQHTRKIIFGSDSDKDIILEKIAVDQPGSVVLTVRV